ncbi:MAG TPA: hypothetical protein VMT53_00325 [Terriglobales bacterium]|nr:hypothetical protein [Terriglobales bacterium]
MVVKSIRVTVETDTLMVVRHAKAVSAWCPDCGAHVDAVTLTPESFPDAASAALMQQWLAAGKLHLWHSTEGAVQVCVNSLLLCSS